MYYSPSLAFKVRAEIEQLKLAIESLDDGGWDDSRAATAEGKEDQEGLSDKILEKVHDFGGALKAKIGWGKAEPHRQRYPPASNGDQIWGICL